MGPISIQPGHYRTIRQRKPFGCDMETEVNLSVKELEDWGIPVSGTFIIAGPCSAETEEQVMSTIRELAKHNVSAIRAGIWKPRTRPGSFEGVGGQGLKWLKDAGNEVGLPVAVEVANPRHVEECLKYGIDLLWVGARTSANPFSVQAIAEALKGVDIPVLVKNPVNPDLELWIGAIERLHRAGLERLAAIHRGFCTYRTDEYRNTPLWRLAIELRRRIPGLPIICDPSHICGKTELLLSVAQKALDLLYSGLMIEVHINPACARSDAKQQLTPDQFGDLIRKLKRRSATSSSEEYLAQIAFLRKEIDDIDRRFIELLARRMDIARQIGAYKGRNNISLFQPNRWSEIVESRTRAGREGGLSEEFILKVFHHVHEESIRSQEQGYKESGADAPNGQNGRKE